MSTPDLDEGAVLGTILEATAQATGDQFFRELMRSRARHGDVRGDIARIYEQSGQSEDALVQCEPAQEENAGKVYADVVARMKTRRGR